MGFDVQPQVYANAESYVPSAEAREMTPFGGQKPIS